MATVGGYKIEGIAMMAVGWGCGVTFNGRSGATAR